MPAKKAPATPGQGWHGKFIGRHLERDESTAPSDSAPVCPLACSKSPCVWKCPVVLRDAVEELVAELAVTR